MPRSIKLGSKKKVKNFTKYQIKLEKVGQHILLCKNLKDFYFYQSGKLLPKLVTLVESDKIVGGGCACVRERERGPSQMQARHSLERGIKGEGSEKQEGGTTTTTTTSMNESISGAASCRTNETNGLA